MLKVVITSFCFIFILFGQKQIILTHSFNEAMLSNNIYLYVDAEKKLSIQDMIKQPQLFKPVSNSDLIFGYTNDAIWLRMDIVNETFENWVVSLTTSNLRYVDFYRVDSTRIQETKTGFYRPFNSREIDFADFSFFLKPSKDYQAKRYFIRVENVGRTDLPLFFKTEHDYLSNSLRTQFIFGLYNGMLLIMIGYNLILALTLRDRGYLNYSLFLLFFTIAISALDTLFQQYIMPDYPVISADIFRIFMNLAILFALSYTNNLLNLKDDQPRLYQISTYLKIALWIKIIITVFYYNILIANILIISSCSLMIVAGIVQARTGYKPAKVFVGGWLIFLLSVILLTLPIGEFTLNFMRFGTGIMVMFLSIALSDRIRLLRQEKMKIQKNLITEKDKMIRIKDELNESLKRSMSELESKNSELEQFTYTVSHDLKNPLFTIQGYLGQLKEDAVKGDIEAIDRDMNYIDVATSTMSRLLEDLLNLSRIGYKINPTESVSIDSLIDDALRLFAKQIDDLGIKIKRQERYPHIIGDQIRLHEVFQNLIANAIKFSQHDQPNEISITAEENNTVVRCIISDNGIGIDPKYKERVFILFEQLDPADNSGTGIGLSIVKRIIEFHGGKIWVESDGINKGCRFIFELPKTNGDN